MANDSSKMTHEQSLAIISEMIQQAKGNIKGSSFHFLLWGWVVVIGNLSHFYLMNHTNYDRPYMVWLITIPAWIISMIYGYKQGRSGGVSTYSGNLILWAWLAFTFSIIIVIFSGQFGSTIPALILLIAAFPTFITGMIIKFKPLIIGGSTFWVFATLAFLFPMYSLLISALGILCGYLIPGYLLKKAE